MSKTKFKLFDKASGNEIQIGDEVQDFRRERKFVLAIYPPGGLNGASGKVGLGNLRDAEQRLFYPSVINAEFRLVEIHVEDGLFEEPRPGTVSYRRNLAREKGYDE